MAADERLKGWLTGLEPVTSRSTIDGDAELTENRQEVTPTPSEVCTRVCTDEGQSLTEGPATSVAPLTSGVSGDEALAMLALC